MAITDKEQGVWDVDQVYNKINQGSIWGYNAVDPFRLFAWQKNDDQNLGLNDRINRSSPTQIGTNTSWGGGKDMPHSNWFNGGGGANNMALKQDGTIWRWSEGKNGTSGANLPNYTWPSSPIQLGTDADWYQLSGNSSTMLAVKTDGTLWSWGLNTSGQLGLNFAFASPPSQNQRSSPCQVGSDTNWDTGIPGGQSETNFAVKTDGTLWVWGSASGLNVNPAPQRSSPTQIPGTTWTSAGACSGNGSARFIKSDGTLWTWGHNSRGQLGLNDVIYRSSPTQVPGTTWKSNYATGVNGDGASALGIKTDGTLWSWGYNRDGRLGLNQGPGGIPDSVSSPTQVGTDTNWESISGKGGSSFGIKTDGTAWVWGINSLGSLGLNQSTNPAPSFPAAIKYSSPTQLPGTDWAVFKNFTFQQMFALKKGT